MSLKESKIS